jgi:hypothetical protein
MAREKIGRIQKARMFPHQGDKMLLNFPRRQQLHYFETGFNQGYPLQFFRYAHYNVVALLKCFKKPSFVFKYSNYTSKVLLESYFKVLSICFIIFVF